MGIIPQVRRFIQECLPAYMIPGMIVSIDALPLTPNGKLDCRMLPVPEEMNANFNQKYVELQTEEERQLAQIWADVLHLEQVGRDDDYVELGGDSVRSIQLISRAKKVGVVITSKQLFEFRTIAALLESIHTQEV